MDKVMHEICGMFHDVLYTLAERGQFKDEADVQTAKAAVSGIVKIKTLEAMEKYGGESSFRSNSYDEDGGGMSQRSYRGSYDGGESYRRGRGGNGRYVSRDSIKDKLARMMDEATNEQDRNMIREMLDKMQ